MFVTSSFITLSLVLSGTATPLDDGAGTPIAIEKRSALTSSDGHFNHPRAVQQIVHDRNKQRSNLMNLKRNKGVSAFNKGAYIPPLATLSNNSARSLEARQAESLADEDNDLYWAGMITIGSNKQAFLIDFDTGSSDLWVPSIECTSFACVGKHRYIAATSTTSEQQSGNFSIRYADNSTVSGPVYTDTVAVAGVTATNQYFSPVTTLSSSFGSEKIDGILGMAFREISRFDQDPYFNTAKAQGAVKNGAFAFKLAKTGSELYLGGTNPQLYTGPIEYHNVVGTGFWQIGNGKAVVGSKAVVSNFQTIIDSGTTLIYGPPDQVRTLYANIPGSKEYDNNNGMYSVPCKSVPNNVGFSWGGKSWTISAANFNLGQDNKSNGTQCVGAIMGVDLGLGDGVWLLGDSFMKNVYTVFSFDENAVGFATLQ